MSKLRNLQDLNISGNERIQTLQTSFEELKRLQKCDLSNCKLKRYPDVFSKLITLHELNLIGNSVTSG